MPELSEDEFCFIAKRFIEESGWDLTYNEDNTKNSYKAFVNNPNTHIIAIRRHGVVMGGAVVSIDNFAFLEAFGYILKFYVLKPFRDGIVSKHIMQRCNEWFENKKAKAVFIQPLARIGKSKAMLRLFKRAGYTQELITLYKE